MPRIGNVDVSDGVVTALRQGLAPPAPARPGLGAVFSGALQSAYGQVRYGVPYALAKLTDSATPEDEAFYQHGLQQSDVASNAAPAASVDDVTSGRVGIGRFLAENLVASAPQSVAIAAGGLGGALVGGPVGAVAGAIAAGTPTFVGSNVDRAVQEQGGLSQAGAESSLFTAPFQAASDALVERYLPGAGHVLGDFAATQTGNFIRRTAVSIGKAGATEAVAEAAQQMGERHAAGLDVTGPDAAAEYINAAVTAFGVGGVLGAGGGFRRHPAMSEHASDVAQNPATMNDFIDAALGSTPPAGEQQGSLPLQGGTSTEAQPGLPFAQPAEAPEVRPSMLPQLGLDPNFSTVAPDTQLSLGQRFNDNTQPSEDRARAIVDLVRNPAPAPATTLDMTSPAVQDLLRNMGLPVKGPLSVDGSTPGTSARTGGNLALNTEPAAVEATPELAVTDQPRMFADHSLDVLNTAIKGKGISDEARTHAQQEIATRYAEAAGVEPLTSDFKTRLGELKDGLRGSFVQKLDATDTADLREKVYNRVFDDQDTSSSTVKLAQRMGILDDKLEPGPVAQAVEAQRAAAAPEAEAAPTTVQMGEHTVELPQLGNTTDAVGRAIAKSDALRSRYIESGKAKIAAGNADNLNVFERTYLRQEDRVAAGLPATLSPEEREAQRTATQQLAKQVTTDGTPVGTTPTEAATTPPAAVSLAPATVEPGFTEKWDQITKDAGIDRMRSAKVIGDVSNMAMARANVFAALADDKITRNGQASQVERLAQAMGLVSKDDNLDVTPLGHQVYLSTPAAAPEIETASRQQGFEPGTPGATAFQQGVQAFATGTESAHTSFEDMAAYQAGKVWAQDSTKAARTTTIAQTRAIQERLATRPNGTAVDRTTVERAQLTPAQVNQASLNRLLDAADLRGVKDTDAAALRRMVANGATSEEVGQALQQVQGGTTLFQQPATVPTELSPLPVRGQPIFKEMNTRERGPNRAAQRAETKMAARVYEARNSVDYAQEQGRISKDRAQKLHDMLDEGKVDQAERLVAISNAAAKVQGKPAFGGGFLGGADAKFEQAIAGKSFTEIAQHMADNDPSAYHRAVMGRVLALSKEIEKAGGHDLSVRVVGPNDAAPVELSNPDVRAWTEISRNPSVATVWLKSAEMGMEAGTNYQLAAHEMLHATTMQALDYARKSDPDGKTALGKAAKDLTDLAVAVRAHLNDRLDNASYADYTPFEIAAAMREHNAFSDPDELIAWGLTNPTMQSYLQGIAYKPRTSVFSRLVGLVRNLLGLPETAKSDTALTELMRVSDQVLGTSARELAPAFVKNNPNGGQQRVLMAAASEAGTSAANRTVTASTQALTNLAGMTERVMERVPVDGVKGRMRQALMYVSSQNQLDRQYGHLMPAMLDRTAALTEQKAVNGRFGTIANQNHQSFEQLKASAPKMAAALNELMAKVGEFRVDPDKAFNDHTHLGFIYDEATKTRTVTPGQEAAVAGAEKVHAEAVKLKNDLSRGDGAGYRLFKDFTAYNEAEYRAQIGVELHNLIVQDPELKLSVADAAVNPMEDFMRQEGLATPQQVRAYWQKSLYDQMAAATQFVQDKKGSVESLASDEKRAMQLHLAPIEEKLGWIHGALEKAGQAPYVHLGRFGDNFGAAKFKTDANGNTDIAARDRVVAALRAAGFTDSVFSPENLRNGFNLRFEKVQQERDFRAVADKLAATGDLTDVKSGPRDQASNYGVVGALPGFIQRQIQNLRNDPRFKATDDMTDDQKKGLAVQQDALVRSMLDTWLEGLPDSSVAKVMAKRLTVSGFSKDMVRAQAFRANVGAHALGVASVSAKMNKAEGDMRAQLIAARAGGDEANGQDPHVISDLYNEVQKRSARDPLNQQANGFDKLRTVAHAYFLGFSPAYGAIQLMQIGTNGLPELAKTHGFGKSFHALKNTSAAALRVVKAANEEARAQGWKHAADISLTENVLKRAGLSESQGNFLRHLVASGSLDIGTAAHAMMQISNGTSDSKLNTPLKFASAMGLYTETFSRLSVALAAHDLHMKNTAGANTQTSTTYAKKVISEAMFDYDNWNTARAFGKQGFAGRATPLLTQFMSFSLFTMEKLHSEFHNMVGSARPGESAEATAARRKASATYLAGHLTAITAMAGTLGLPFASVFASVLERIVNSTRGDGDPPFDATAAWRNFLAGVFGKDAAEVVARGLPRAVGFDISRRVGESDILPFTQMLSDRHSWREAVQSAAGRSVGAAPDMLLNVADAGNQFANGDVLGGLKSILPVAFKGPTEAYRMTSQGYVDTHGQRLPMTPGAADIMYQLLGFTPSDRAEYSEARTDQSARQLTLVQESQVLRNRIVQAMTSGDHAEATRLVARAQAFDQANPTFGVLSSIPGALQRRTQRQIDARVAQAPAGVLPSDRSGQALTHYANVNYR